MDLLKSQFDRIQQQLAGLNASQKMLAACLVVIIVMTIGWWGRYAAVPEMEAVTHEALSPEDLQAVRRQLRSSGIPHQVNDGRVEVPADRVPEAVADLTYSQALPKSSAIDFQSLVKGMNPFTSQSTTEAQFNNYTQVRLAEVIANFPGVQAAEVFIDPTDKPGIGKSVEPSATVSITMTRGQPAPQRLIDATAHFVAGSNAKLKWQRVSVIVDGVFRRVRDSESDGGGGAEHLEIVEKYENSVEEKVSRFLNIPQLSVSVSFNVDPETKRTRSHQYDKDNFVHKEIETNERTVETTDPVPAAGEPGAMPNTAMSIGGAAVAVAGAGGAASSNESESKTKMQLLVGDRTQEVFRPAGIGEPVAAAVRVPRSHVINMIKHERAAKEPDAPEPDAQAIDARFTRDLPAIRGAVKGLVRLASDDAVLVSMYTDYLPGPGPVGPGGGAGQGFSTASVAAMAGAHSREILLGGLAVMSLFMVSMMVRKGNPLPAAAAALAMPAMPMPVLDASESLAGEVSEGKSMLDAMELDDDAVRAQQMVDQVSSMVEENPDAAAGLVKRWLNRS